MPKPHFDFALLLVVLTLVTGVGWLLDKLFLARRRGALIGDGADRPGWIVEFCTSFFPVILAVLLLRSFVVEPFRIPSGSMIPTLLVGDFILVNKFAYGLRDPVLHKHLAGEGKPQRGDVVVFRWPVDTRNDFIKRIVGVPGDRIAYRDKKLTVNGEPVDLEADGVYVVPNMQPPAAAYRYRETINGVRHHLIVNPNRPADDFEFTVPEGQYFAMGDNRDGSYDSRGWGTVPESNLVGKAFLIWMSWDSSRLRPYWNRIGTAIH